MKLDKIIEIAVNSLNDKKAKEIKAEVKKIVWPTKAQVINNTLVVIVVSIIAAICIFGLDTIFGFIVRFIYGV